jgi:hypothetical protein
MDGQGIQLLEVSKLVIFPHKNQTENLVPSSNLQKKVDFKCENQHVSISNFIN